MTSENDLDVVNMGESPNAVFIIVPDERFTRHRFVTLFINGIHRRTGKSKEVAGRGDERNRP